MKTDLLRERVGCEDTHIVCSCLQMNRVTAKFRATKRAAGMECIEYSWDREICRFAVASPDKPSISRLSKHVEMDTFGLRSRIYEG